MSIPLTDWVIEIVTKKLRTENKSRSKNKYTYYMSTKTKFNVIYCNHMFHSHSILKSTFPNSSTFPPQATELYNPKWTLMSVCVWRFGVSFTYVIESIGSKLISVCLNNDYSLIADLHIFIYGRAEFAIISLECTMVKLLIYVILGKITIGL